MLSLVSFLRKLDGLIQLEAKHGQAIARIEAELVQLKDRVTRLETRDDVLIAEAKGAASTAATVAATGAIADLARRIGAMEERNRIRTLPPPDQQDTP